MVFSLNVRRLNRLSWLAATVVGIVFYIIYANHGDRDKLYPYTTLTVVSILLTGYADVIIMILISRVHSIKSKRFTLYRLLLTFPAAILIYLLAWPLFAFLGPSAGRSRILSCFWPFRVPVSS